MSTEIKIDNIHPISEFHDNFNDILEETNQTGEPIIITRKGKPVGVFLSPESFKEYALLKEEASILKAIEKSEKEIEAGLFLTQEQLKEKLDRLFT